MNKRTRRGLVRKYYIFLVNLKMELDNNDELSVYKMLREYKIDTRLQKALHDLKIVSRGRIKQWIVTDPTMDMAKACIKQILLTRRVEAERRKQKKEQNLFSNIPEEKYHNTTHKEFKKANPKAIRVGSGYYHTPENKRYWKQVFSFKIFGIKCKFFKLK